MSAPAARPGATRVDMHLHSRASTDTGSWFVRRAGVPESYTEPEAAYAAAKRRGMDMVALTDHNTISGALEIAHHPDVLVGVEITTTFPEDRVQLHVLAWGVDEARWADMDRLRPNVHELVGYLTSARVPFALAHPLHRVGDTLTADHLERCLLMFPLWEGRNGARPSLGNEMACRIARAASPELLGRLAEKHGIPPLHQGPPALTGGSDDHGSFDIACAWTEFPPAATPADVVDHLRAGRVRPGGSNGSSETLAHSVGALATTAMIERGVLALPDPVRLLLGDILQRDIPAGREATGGGGMAGEVLGGVRRDHRLVRRYRRLSRGEEGPARSHARVRLATGWIHARMLERVAGPGWAGLGPRVEAAAGAAMAAAPYLLSAHYVAGEERFAREMGDDFFGPDPTPAGPVPAVMLTDTYRQLNGVAGTMRRLADYAGRRPERRMTVITCDGKLPAAEGLVDLAPVTQIPLPGYSDRNLRPGVPSLIDLLEAVQASGAEVVHAATPGPMGLAGLAVARALGLPFVVTHHTELGRYALELTGDRLAAAIVTRALAWFYAQADRVYVPSQSSVASLVDAGVPASRVVPFTRGIDLDAFHPDRATRRMRWRLGGRNGTVVLYVGRISREKGVEVLADAMRRACAVRGDLHLAVVGDGPARGDLARRLDGVPHRFLGPLTGDPLSAAFASADMFCLPSTTETFGQVLVEAAASGLPCVVSDRGASHERVVDGRTGLVAQAEDAGAFAQAILALAEDEVMRREMGEAAERDARMRPSWDAVFDELTGGYRRHGRPDPDPEEMRVGLPA